MLKNRLLDEAHRAIRLQARAERAEAQIGALCRRCEQLAELIEEAYYAGLQEDLDLVSVESLAAVEESKRYYRDWLETLSWETQAAIAWPKNVP